MRIVALVLVLVLVSTSVPAENATSCGGPAELQDGWAVSSPEQQGLDPKLICAIGPRFEGWEEADPHGVVVVRHGVLVYEHYFTFGDELGPGEVLGEEPRNASTKHDVYSITKSVTALLTGIAFDRGWLKDLDAPIFSFLPQYVDLRTPEKDRITLRHLLTMTSGLDWPENKRWYDDPVNISRRMGGSSDPVRFVLEQPLAAPPGTVWNYNSGGVEMLGVILTKVSGRLLDQVAVEALFDPLGITDWQPGTAAYGLQLRPRDLAKIGQLVLNHGDWHGRRIVSANWVKEMTAPQVPRGSVSGPASVYSYGYLWWLGRSSVHNRDIGWVAGFGRGGQRLYVVPDQDLVVAVTAGVRIPGASQALAGEAALNDFVLPAALTH